MKYIILLFIQFLFALSLLFTESEPKIVLTENFNIEINIRNIRRIDDDTVKIKARISIINFSESSILFNLNNLHTYVNSKNCKSKVYIDSIATVLIVPVKISPLDTYTKDIYWIITQDSDIIEDNLTFNYLNTLDNDIKR